MLKKLTLLILLIPVVAFSQTSEVSNDVKKHCKAYGDYGFWSEGESVCSVTFKDEKTVMHYVGGWSVEGANGYGQFYEYDADNGTLMSIYKGQFKKSMFNGIGRLEETYDNSQGESVTRITIGNWENDKASGLIYQKSIHNLTKNEAIFFGNANEGVRHGYSILEMTRSDSDDTAKTKEVWIANFVDDVWIPENSKISVLFLDDTAHGWVQHKFFGKDVDSLKSQSDFESEKISIR